ncbi:CBS domain-containing protein [Stygiolobus caldivivus]|uniref:Histidine kinase n=1 Tax=Stygiolobus caldivivus TaxID=2824673 RepID=A0A8D5U5Q7_9CREN|nr:CBS domain-containing protein [Stygiolobus caldivivus]BCU69366.1 histidine kinase [Stygiolobus caldivivus]
MKVIQLVNRKPVTASSDITIKRAAELMKKEGIGSIVISDKEYNPLGIVTERDIIYAIADNVPLDSPIDQIMSQNPVTIDSEADISEAVALMSSRGIRHLVVVNKDGKVVGVISIKDVVKAVGSIALDLAFW